MRTVRLPLLSCLIAAAGVVLAPLRFAAASDHADPLVLNMLRPVESREPRITDLHVFLNSDAEGGGRKPEALVISVCVFPSMPPLEMVQTTGQTVDGIELPLPARFDVLSGNAYYRRPDLKLDDYRYTINLDFHSAIEFKSKADVARYGGTITDPGAIGADVTLTFTLNNDATINDLTITGFEPGQVLKNEAFQPGVVNVRSGIFDDPFIFPRFFRRNVVGTIFSIPLTRLPNGAKQMIVWATSHKGTTQLDHVGRSQRTQLPRFDGLNTLPPAKHVEEINRRHNNPTLTEDFMRTFLSSLFARRPYDAVPDVIVFRTSEPTNFPNGRKLPDDVAYLTAMQGDTQLWEASFTDHPDYRNPRNDNQPLPGTFNDKPFNTSFPYLASPWTREQVMAQPAGFALGRPALHDASWRKLGFIILGAMVLAVLLLWFTLKSVFARFAVIGAAVLAVLLLLPVFRDNLPSSNTSPEAVNQQSKKLCRLILGAGAAGALYLAWLYALGRRHGAKAVEPDGVPEGVQSLTAKDDRQYKGSTFQEVRKAVMEKPYYGVWEGQDVKPLPVYPVRLAKVISGFLSFRKPFHFGRAQHRTLRSKADLRWGDDGKGVRRLLHPNGICLTGDWIIDKLPADSRYTGAFHPGTTARIISRYSTCCTETRGGHWRSLSMVNKIYLTDSDECVTPANFFTQEDLGGTLSHSIRDVFLTNSPPVSAWRRGKGIFTFLLTGFTFARADKRGTEVERQLYQVAELGKPPGTDTVCPRFIRLTVSPSTWDPGGSGLDYREEILDIMYDRGNPVPKRKLVFDIEISDEGERVRHWFKQRLTGQKWIPVGRIEFDEAAASHNGDFVIHFQHAPWREDRNRPGSEFLPDLNKGESPPAPANVPDGFRRS